MGNARGFLAAGKPAKLGRILMDIPSFSYDDGTWHRMGTGGTPALWYGAMTPPPPDIIWGGTSLCLSLC